jgi:hypothetical protein
MLKKTLSQSGIAGALFLLLVATFLIGTSLPATAQLSQQDFLTFQANLQTLTTFLQQTAGSDTNQLALANDLQNKITSLSSDQLYQVASSFNVGTFNNAVTALTTVKPTQRNVANTDPPSNLFNPNFLICQLVQQVGNSAGLTLVPSDPSVIKALELSIDVAKIAAVAADKLCDGVVVVAGEGTTLPQCVIADVLDLIAEALERTKEVLTFCDPVVNAAETEATWQNSVVIDTDLATHDANVAKHLDLIDQHLTLIDTAISGQNISIDADVDNRIVAVDTDLTSRIVNTDADLNNHVTGIDTDLNTHLNSVDTDLITRATQLDTEVGMQSSDFTLSVPRPVGLRELALRLKIEQALTTGQMIGLFELPQAKGGYLDLVRSTVVDVINKMLSAGLSVGTASKSLTTGDSNVATGQYKTAYKYYASAYQAAVN